MARTPGSQRQIGPDPGPQTPVRTPDYEACLGAWALKASARGCAFGFFGARLDSRNFPLKPFNKNISEGSRLKFRCKSTEAADVLSSPLPAPAPIREKCQYCLCTFDVCTAHTELQLGLLVAEREEKIYYSI